jgi:hypothetical protein
LVSDEILSYFPKELEVFSWKSIPTLNERFLLKLCFDLFKHDVDISFITNYGVFEINNVIDKYKDINNGLNYFDFYLKILDQNVSSEKSKFYYIIFSELDSKEWNKSAFKFDELITEPYYRAQYLMLLNDFELECSIKEIRKYFKEMNSLEKADVLYKLYSNQNIKTLKQEIKVLENSFLKITNEILHQKLNELLTEEESFLEKDHNVRKIMLVESTLARLIIHVNHQEAIRIITQVIKRSDDIKNGAVKGQAVIEVQQMLLLVNKDLEDIANNAYIPRVPLGGLSYGQYKISNLLDLSENSWNLNHFSKAYKFLLEAESNLISIEELTNKEQVSLRMINLFLKHNKHLKARNILKRLTISQIRFSAIEMIANYYVKNHNKRLRSLFKEGNFGIEQKMIIKYIFNHMKYIDIKELNVLLFKYLKSTNTTNQLYKIENKARNIVYNLPKFLIDKNKTLPPFFSNLYNGDKFEESVSEIEKLSSFQKLYFSKNQDIIDDILKINDNLSESRKSYFKNLLRNVFEDDFNSFEKKSISINNKFNLIQLVHHIFKRTKKPYLYINHIEKHLDSKLFYNILEPIEYNMRIVGLDNSNNEFKCYKLSKVLKSERLALLTQIKN